MCVSLRFLIMEDGIALQTMLAESAGRLAETHNKNAALATQHKAEAAAFLARANTEIERMQANRAALDREWSRIVKRLDAARATLSADTVVDLSKLKALYVEHTGVAGLDTGGIMYMPPAMNTPPESPAPAPPKAGKNAAVHAPVSTTGEAEKKKAKKKKRQKKMKVGGAAGAAAAAVSEHSGAKPTKGGALHDAQAQSYVDMHFVCKTVYATVCTFVCALLKLLCVTLFVATAHDLAPLNWFKYFGDFDYVYTGVTQDVSYTHRVLYSIGTGIARWHQTVAYVFNIDLAVYILALRFVAIATILRHLSPTTTEYAEPEWWYYALVLGLTSLVDRFVALGIIIYYILYTFTTPLHIAATYGYTAVAEALLKCKADVNYATIDGCTPLYIAAWKGHVDVVTALLGHNADPNKACTIDGCTPLFVAVQYGHTAVAGALLKGKADANQAMTHGGNGAWTPLYKATINGHTAIADLLKQHGAV